MKDTIAAIATPAGEGGVGILRLSGEDALAIADKLFLPKSGAGTSTQKNFKARYGHVFVAEEGKRKTLDEALLLVMRSPNSYTGEDIAEIQAHGGPALLQMVLALAVRHGARQAEPGEFTKRAFLNGRLDLVQAEAVLDLIQAKTETSVRWAASQLEGRLSAKARELKDRLLETLTHLEAGVDFPDDAPETDSLKHVDDKLDLAENELRELLKGSDTALLHKRGLKAALWGRPNVGKSSLLNRLTGTERVIVTPIPGTTRDVVEEEALLGGFLLRFQDTAGIQSTENPIEKQGVERSRMAMHSADLVLFVLDASRPLDIEDKKLWGELAGRPKMVVLNKSDLPRRIDISALPVEAGVPVIPNSCVAEGGDKPLREAITLFLSGGGAEISDQPMVQSVRQKEYLEKALEALGRARQACSQGMSFEFIASDVRQGLDHLGALVGEVVTDDILEVLFRKFCIGK